MAGRDFGDEISNPGKLGFQHGDQVFAFDEVDAEHVCRCGGRLPALRRRDLAFEMVGAFLEAGQGFGRA